MAASYGIRILSTFGGCCFAFGAAAAPTTECNSAPWRYFVEIFSPSASLSNAIVDALAQPSTSALLDRLGNPIAATPRTSFYSGSWLELRYNPAQDTVQIAADLSRDPSIGGQFTSILPDGGGACFATSPAPITVDLTEYYNTILGHYFISGSAYENASIDSGGAGPGWVKTGQHWRTFYPDPCTYPAKAVYRFYGTPGVGPNSHFYTADPAECGGLRNGIGWQYEGIAFGAELPVQGQCPARSPRPLYRAYNNRWMYNDSNHRYASDTAIYQQMIAAGWIGEGVALCLPNEP